MEAGEPLGDCRIDLPTFSLDGLDGDQRAPLVLGHPHGVDVRPEHPVDLELFELGGIPLHEGVVVDLDRAVAAAPEAIAVDRIRRHRDAGDDQSEQWKAITRHRARS